MKRKRRKLIACLTVGMLLFAQFVVAGYACPFDTQGFVLTSQAAPELPAKPCHDVAEQNPNLCKQHCERAAQSVDNRAQPKIDMPTILVLAVALQPHAYVPQKWLVPRASSPHIVEPQLYLYHCSFLI